MKITDQHAEDFIQAINAIVSRGPKLTHVQIVRAALQHTMDKIDPPPIQGQSFNYVIFEEAGDIKAEDWHDLLEVMTPIGFRGPPVMLECAPGYWITFDENNQ